MILTTITAGGSNLCKRTHVPACGLHGVMSVQTKAMCSAIFWQKYDCNILRTQMNSKMDDYAAGVV